MMLIDSRVSLLVVVLLSSVLLLVTAVGICLALRFKQYRSRPYLPASCFFLFQALGIGGLVLRSILNGRVDDIFDVVLRPITLINGFLTLSCILAYMVEIKSPGNLSFKKYLIGISPVLLLSAILALIHPNQLHDVEEIFTEAGRPEVFLRLAIVFFYFACTVVVVCQPYEWRQCLVSRKTMAVLHILTCLISPAFIAGLMCGFFPAILVNYVVAIAIDTLVAYIEFKIRIPVPDPIRDDDSLQDPSSKDTCDAILESPEIWMNPDMTATELAKILGTNHTYLLGRIKGLGYSNYSDMINRKRVEYICKGLENSKDVNIISLMFEAGFRSRSTASREFKRIVGCAPSEYLGALS